MIDINNIGESLYELAKVLFPINRSITGNGVRETLDIIDANLPIKFNRYEIPSGSKVFDWQVPQEWHAKEAWIKAPNGEVIASFAENNLHLVGYSTAFQGKLTLEELKKHLYSLPDQPKAIPYVTSYYSKRWGFCLSHEQLSELSDDGDYEVYIDSSHFDGHLTYADYLLPGESEKEILLSSYTCHPSMANNELSGPLVTIAVLCWLYQQPHRKYSYRFVLTPETIGAISYLAHNLEHLKQKVFAGFVLTCIGDNGDYSMLESRYGNTLSDRAAKTILKQEFPERYQYYSFLKRGSDERQYCAPGIDLPIASLMRTKYGVYPEYHTSEDNLDFISPEGLEGGFQLVQKTIASIEANAYYTINCLGEPQLGKYGLYPTTSQKGSSQIVRNLINVIAYCDGQNDIFDISEITGVPVLEVIEHISKLDAKGLVSMQSEKKS